METGSYVDSKSRVCFFFFFLRAFSQLPFLDFFFTFDSCTILYPCFFFLNLSGMLKNVFACLLISYFLPFLVPFTHKSSADHYISLATNFLCHPFLFLHLFLFLTSSFSDD
ncbi:hypothetical protein HOY82DRAFT_259534 [Tuber indicum]|nr:hypothetical protein HOY82DRAFT_259534 [Tuber indicum]